MLAKRRSSRHRFSLGGHPHKRGSSSERYKHMWGYSHLSSRPELHGPHEVRRLLSEDDMKEAIRSLVERYRQICIDYRRHKVSGRVAQWDEIEEQLRQLSRHFYFKDSQRVCEFLNNHRSLIPIAFEVRKKFEQYFGEDSLSNLEVFTDPEDSGHSSKLFALVLTRLPARDALPRLDQLDRDWWLCQPYEVRSKMSIDLKYIDGLI
jgi:hypothetical protein